MSRREVIRRISEHPFLAVTFELAAGLMVSVAALGAFAALSEVVFEERTRRIDTGLLLWIHSTFPAWLDAPMRLVTALGNPRVVAPLLLLAALAFYRRRHKLSAALLLISVPGAAVLSIVLKGIYERVRPDLFDTGYTALSYSFPSGHAVTAVSFYGVLTLLVGLGWLLGAQWAVVRRYAHFLEYGALAVIAAAGLWFVWNRWSVRG